MHITRARYLRLSFFVVLGLICCQMMTHNALAGALEVSGKASGKYTASSPINLNQAIDHALETHPKLFSAREEVKAQEYALRKVKGEYLPSVSMRLSAAAESSDTPSLRDQDLSDEFMKPTESQVMLRQFIYDGGLLKSRVLNQSEEVRAATFRQLNTVEEVVLEALVAYLNVLRADELYHLAVKNVALHEEIYNKVVELYHGKVTDQANVSLAKSRLVQAKTIKLNAREDQLTSRATFTAVTQLSHYKLHGVDVRPIRLPMDLRSMISHVLSHNLRLKALEADVVAASASVRGAKANFLPSIDLELDSSYDNDVGGIKGRHHVNRGSIVLNYNLYNGGSDVALKRELQAKYRQSKHELEQTRREIEEQATQYWQILAESPDKLKELNDYVKSSKKLYHSYREQFKYGKQTLFNVLDGGSQLYNARVAKVERSYFDMTVYYRLVALSGELASLMSS